MTAQRVIQCYKSPRQWIESPPGLGDYIRGACHLFETLAPLGIDLRLDVSQTGFATLIAQDEAIFQTGDASRIASAGEYFEDEDHLALRERLMAFRRSGQADLYVSTNLGAWDRLTLPEATRQFAGAFYRFSDEVERETAALAPAAYEVLSVRCGDHCYHDPAATPPAATEQLICSIVERHVLPRHQCPIVVTSDCYSLKVALARRYGMTAFPHHSQHGAFGNERPVAVDLCLLKHSRFNYHINAWADWWSGFSHYTSMVFRIPSMNFRAPRYEREEVTATGQLLTARRWWQVLARG